MTALSFRPYLPKDAQALADLFVASIEELTQDDYDADQRAAWASAAEDVAAFGAKLGADLTILAEIKGVPLGFASLKDDPKVQGDKTKIQSKTIEMLYVSPDAAGQGIGKALLNVMELLARQRGAEALLVESSETARAFFAKFGYEMQARNTVIRAGEWLVNTSMKKMLPQQAAVQTGNA